MSTVQGQELFTLIRGLLTEPASRFHAAVAEWSSPISREEMKQLELIDLLLMRWMPQGKFKPVPRPWDVRPKKSGLSSAEAHKRLRPHLYKT